MLPNTQMYLTYPFLSTNLNSESQYIKYEQKYTELMVNMKSTKQKAINILYYPNTL